MSERKRLKVCVILLIVVAAAVMAAVLVPSTGSKPTDTAKEEPGEPAVPYYAVEIGGVLCVPKPDIKTYLFMGLDAKGEAAKSGEYDGTGQCDVLQVLVVDQKAGIYRRLTINRDTMTDVRILDDDGYYLSTKNMQIALASVTGGDEAESGCENTVNAVSGLLYDQPIDGYAAVSMDVIGILNHLAGGVTVTIEDDFSAVDPTLVRGETVTLTDEQAMHYVRSRKGMGDDSNENRMERQANYQAALKTNFKEKCKEDMNFALDLYDALGAYMVTDMSRSLFFKLAAEMMDLAEEGPMRIEGVNTVGDHGYIEFAADEDSLTETVRTLFYDVLEAKP